MTYSLHQLEAQLHKTVSFVTDERETDECPQKGFYVWRTHEGEKYFWSPTPIRYGFSDVTSLAEADGIMFLCPECFNKNGGPVGTHSVLVSFAGRGAADEAGSKDSAGRPSRWQVSGTGLDDLVLTPSIALNVSVQSPDACHWHGFVGSSGIPPGHAG